MAHTLTRSQLVALTELHRGARVSSTGAGRTYARPNLRTLERLHLLQWDRTGAAAAPLLQPWADGFGIWRVVIPEGIDNPAAVARAVILGELQARGTVDPRRVRVVLEIGRDAAPRTYSERP